MESIAAILNNLITINKERIVGYKEAIHDTKASHIMIIELFKDIISQSGRYIEELKEKIHEIGAEVSDKTITAGFVYNTWMDIIYSGADSKPPVKEFCKQLEETTLQAYEADLNKIKDLDKNIYDMLLSEKLEIEMARKQIENLNLA